MALFGSKKKEEKKTPAKKTAATKKATVTAKKVEGGSLVSGVLLRPRVTEKAAHMTAQHAYTFDISPRATKADVAKAVKEIYGVTPKKIAVVKTPGRKVSLRTRRGYGKRGDAKKAYVYLKAGDRIEFAS